MCGEEGGRRASVFLSSTGVSRAASERRTFVLVEDSIRADLVLRGDGLARARKRVVEASVASGARRGEVSKRSREKERSRESEGLTSQNLAPIWLPACPACK